MGAVSEYKRSVASWYSHSSRMSSARTRPAFFRKRKASAGAPKGIMKRRKTLRTMTPSNVSSGQQDIHMVYRGQVPVTIPAGSSCGDLSITLGTLLTAEQQLLVNRFSQGRLSYVVIKVLAARVPDGGVPGGVQQQGIVGGAMLDASAVPTCTTLSALMDKAMSCKPQCFAALNFSAMSLDFMYKPVTAEDRSMKDVSDLLSTTFCTARLAMDYQPASDIQCEVTYYVKLYHKRN